MKTLIGIAAMLAACAQAASPLPEFTRHDAAGWVNSSPLTRSQLLGKVVLLDVWTFECWNCYRSFPWLNALITRHQVQGLVAVGIHTPEFESERDPATVASKARKFGFNHPVMIDNDHAYWNGLGNQYWPSFYLVDRHGLIRYRFVGETHEGDQQAHEVEAAVQKLLAER